MHQFEIKRLIPIEVFGLDASFTNSSMMMVIVVVAASALMILGMSGRALVPGRLQSVAELTYEFVAGIVRDNAGTEGLKYFPLIFTLFIYILFCNMAGMFPYSFTVTSHLAITFTLSIGVIVFVTAIGFVRHGAGFLKLFVPSGVPGWLLPLLVPIEIVSYLIRPFSLGIRLFANMMAGHMMLKVFAGFVLMLGAAAGWLPFLLMIGINALEVLIAFLQAFVFALLTSIYLHDAFHPHH